MMSVEALLRESLKALKLIDVIKSEPGVGDFITKNALSSINQFELTNMVKDRKNSIDLMELRCFIQKKQPIMQLNAEVKNKLMS